MYPVPNVQKYIKLSKNDEYIKMSKYIPNCQKMHPTVKKNISNCQKPSQSAQHEIYQTVKMVYIRIRVLPSSLSISAQQAEKLAGFSVCAVPLVHN